MAKSERKLFKKQTHGKRVMRRRKYVRTPEEERKALNQLSHILRNGGESHLSHGVLIAMPRGIDGTMVPIRRGGGMFYIVVLAPAVIMDEAVARIKFADEAGGTPVVTPADIKEGLVSDGDIEESDPNLPAVVEGVYNDLGCCFLAGADATGVEDSVVAVGGVLRDIYHILSNEVAELRAHGEPTPTPDYSRRATSGDDEPPPIATAFDGFTACDCAGRNRGRDATSAHPTGQDEPTGFDDLGSDELEAFFS